jgi:hypothetical protein
MNMTKVAIYAICLNEEKNVKQFMASAKEADKVVVLDTGSTDKTKQMLADLGAIVYEKEFKPWSFAAARNHCLSLVPEDIDVVVCMDLDEVLNEGWAQKVRDEYDKQPDLNRLCCIYNWSHLPDGKPDRHFMIERIHTRIGYEWRHVVHEYIYWVGEGHEKRKWNHDIVMDHWPDPNKSRDSYLGLLERAKEEEPENDRNSHYLGREYMFKCRWDEAIAELKRHISLESAKWDQERAASCRFIAKCYAAKKMQSERIRWLIHACAECPAIREPWVELSQAYYDNEDFVGCLFAAMKAIAITERPTSYLTEQMHWGAWPYDLGSMGAFKIGWLELAVFYACKAKELAPDDQRIAKNVVFMTDALVKRNTSTIS